MIYRVLPLLSVFTVPRHPVLTTLHWCFPSYQTNKQTNLLYTIPFSFTVWTVYAFSICATVFRCYYACITVFKPGEGTPGILVKHFLDCLRLEWKQRVFIVNLEPIIYQYMNWDVCRGTTHTPETLLTLSKAQVEASIRRWGEPLYTKVCVLMYVCTFVHAKCLRFLLGCRNNIVRCFI